MKTLQEFIKESVSPILEAKNVPGRTFLKVDIEVDSDNLTQEVLDSNNHVQYYLSGVIDMSDLKVEKVLQISPQRKGCVVNGLTMKKGTLIVDCYDNNGVVKFVGCDLNCDTIVVKMDDLELNSIDDMFKGSKVYAKVLKISDLIPSTVEEMWDDVMSEVGSRGKEYRVDVLQEIGIGKIFDTLLLYYNDGLIDGLAYGDGIVITNDRRFPFDEDDEVPVKDLKRLPGYKIGCFEIKNIPFDPGY